MADFHAADLWVAVVPETSQVGPAMEQAGKDAKENFGKGVKGIGKDLRDGLHHEFDQIREKAKGAGKATSEAFNSELVREARKTLGTELGNVIGDKLEGPITNQLKKVAGEHWGQIIGEEISQGIGDTVGDWISGAKKKVKDVKSAADDLKKSFADIKNGELSGVSKALDTIDQRAKDIGIDLGGWTDPIQKVAGGPLQEVQNRTRDIRSQAHDFLDVFKDLPGKIGASATALGALVDGPLAAAVAAAMTIDHALHIDSNTFDPGQHGWGHVLFGKTWDWFGGGDPNTGLDKHLTPPNVAPAAPPGVPLTPQNLLGGPPSNSPKSLNDLLFPGATKSTPNTSAPWANSPWFGHGAPPAPAPSPAPSSSPSPSVPDIPITSGSGGGLKVGGSSLTTPSVTSRGDLRAAGGRVANLLEFAKSLEGTPYSQALRNDCSGMVAKIANVALGLPPEASFSTVNEGQWLFSHGFEPGLGGPNDLNIGWYDHGGGNAGHTAATLPGGIHAESGGSHGSFLLGPGAAGAENSEFTQHAHLRMGNFRASSAAATGPIPTGAEHDPLYVTQSTSGSGAGGAGSSPFQSQGQQLGQGLINGVLQMFGIDGSVFGGKSPLDWGAVKLGGGLLNYGIGLANSMGGGPMGAPGMSAGGGGGLLSGLAGLIPHPGPMVSAGVGPAGGSFSVKDAVGGSPAAYHDNRVIVSGNTIKDTGELVMRQNWEQNSRAAGYKTGLPAERN